MHGKPASKIQKIEPASHEVSQTEVNWSATNRKAFTVKWSTKKFDHLLRARPFVLFIDHKSLIHLDQRHFYNGKIIRWQEKNAMYKI